MDHEIGEPFFQGQCHILSILLLLCVLFIYLDTSTVVYSIANTIFAEHNTKCEGEIAITYIKFIAPN